MDGGRGVVFGGEGDGFVEELGLWVVWAEVGEVGGGEEGFLFGEVEEADGGAVEIAAEEVLVGAKGWGGGGGEEEALGAVLGKGFGDFLAEVVEEVDEEVFGFTPESVDAAWGGEFGEEWVEDPFGALGDVESVVGGGLGAVFDN